MKPDFIRESFRGFRERFLPSLAPAWLCLLVPVLLAAAAAGQASFDPASTPVQLMRYSSVLQEGGAPRSGVVTLAFALYSAPYTGPSLWSEQQSVSLDAEGRYTVLLGAVSPLTASLFPSGEPRWLGVQAGDDPELPRILLASQPYAITASNADQLGGLPAADYVLQSQLPGNPLSRKFPP
jgi:hypothetical protein